MPGAPVASSPSGEGLKSACCAVQRPGRRYSYKVAHGGVVNGFQAPPPVGRKEGFSFLVYGDMGDPHHRKAKAPGCAIFHRVSYYECQVFQTCRVFHATPTKAKAAGCEP